MLKKGVSLFLALAVVFCIIPVEIMASEILTRDELSGAEKTPKLQITEATTATEGTAVTKELLSAGEFSDIYQNGDKEGAASTSAAIIITTAEELASIESGKSYVLGNDIDLSTYNNGVWLPLSCSDVYLDGQGFQIKNLAIPAELNMDYAGLFGNIKGTCIIQNLNIVLSDKAISGQYMAGGIAASFSGEWCQFINCSVVGAINAQRSSSGDCYVGGIIGTISADNYTTITNCQSNVSLNAQNNAGVSYGQTSSSTAAGLCASIGSNNVIISDNCSYGRIAAKGVDNVCTGGLVGTISCQNTEIWNNFTESDIVVRRCISDFSNYSGGLCGNIIADNVNFNNNNSSSNISLDYNLDMSCGGLIGTLSLKSDLDINIEKCSFDGNISVLVLDSNITYCGGIIGSVEKAFSSDTESTVAIYMIACEMNGSINTIDGAVGGLIAAINRKNVDINVENCSFAGQLSLTSYYGGSIGGFIGEAWMYGNCNLYFVNSISDGIIEKTAEWDNIPIVGSFAGYIYGDIYLKGENINKTDWPIYGKLVGTVIEPAPEHRMSLAYLTGWDADNQIAYFDGELLHLGAEVTEATDTSFLDTVQDMVGHYVLVETKVRDDGMIGPDILIRMELVEAGTGTIQERTEDSLTIHDTVYPLALKGEEPLFGADKGDEILYGVQDGNIVVLEPLITTTLRLDDWDPTSRVLTVSNNLTKYTYRVSTLASEESLAFLNASRDSSKDYSIEFAYDSSSKIAYRVYRIYEEPEDPEYYDTPIYETTEEALLGEYAMEWYQAYGDYTDALNTALAHYAGSEDASRASLIIDMAQDMQKKDSGSYSRYLSWNGEMAKIPDSVVNAGYKALAALLYDNACKNPDFSNVDFSNATAGTTLVKAIMKSMSSTTTSYSFGGVKVQLSVLQFGSAKFGDMTCTLNGKQYSAIICSTQTECYETIEAYWESLKDLETQALFNIYTAVATDIWGKSPTKFTKEFLKKHVEKYADELLKAGVGNVADVLNTCFNYYSYVNKISNGDLDNLENLLGAMGSLKFDDSSITDKVVNKAMKVLKNATNKLNQACADYIAGTLEIPPLFSLKQLIVACPVNVMVYNASGEQIGYVGEDDLWYEDSIRITEEGDAKIIDILSAQDISVRFIGTAAGSMSCSIEEYTTEGVPIGRLNFYQIPVQEGQKMEMKLPQRLTGSLQDACIQTGTDMIYPNEYITVNDAGSVLVACNVDPQAIQNGCTVSGDGYYVRGDAVVLTAISGANYNFIGWYQDGILQSTSQVYEFPAIENVEVSAAFAQTYQGFEVEVSGQEGGLAVGSSIFASGETATVFAIPDEGYQFSGWYIGNVLVSEAPEYEFVVNSDTTLLAKFTAISASHVMSYVESIPATCIDTGIFAHWHCSECNKDFSDADGTTELSSIVIPIDPTNHAGGTEVRNAVEATYESEGYTGDTYCLGCNTKIADGTTIPKKTQSGSTSSGGSTSTYTITLEEFENGTITASHKQAPHGTTVTLTITPEEGFTLESLTVRDRNDNMIRVTSKTEAIYSFTMPSSPVQIAAVFSQAINDPDTPLGDLPFLDVSPEAWYKNAVGYVFENGLMSGTSSTTFSPDITTSRGMIVTTLYRLEQSPSVSESSDFSDVEDGQWYSDAIVWASANDIVSGYGNDMFGPDDPVTREQMATILYRYAQFKGYPTTSSADLSKYTDLELLSTWAQEPMKWANVFGIITGTTATTLNPQGNATRAEMAAMLMRFCENVTA